ncbi:MAG: peptidoglycan DD-metalloendopeptidase family protein [Deinococcus sp.]|nr:peptidoglycan DD-metalloendopeptidase family protein [Deinococcus sp.]
MNLRSAGRCLPALTLLTVPLLILPLRVPAQPGPPVPDPLQQQLEQQRAVGERQRTLLAEIRAELASLSTQEQATLAQLDRLNTEIDRLRGQVGVLDLKLRQTETRLGVTGRDILALQARVGQLRRSVGLNLNSLYRERTSEYLALLAQAQTLPELLLHLRWANYAGERHVALIRELDREAARLEGEIKAQRQARAELGAVKGQRQESLNALAARQAEARTLLTGLRRTAAGQRLLEVQGRAELAQTGQNIDTLLDAAVQQQGALATQRRRALEAQRQREAATAARLRAAAGEDAKRASVRQESKPAQATAEAKRQPEGNLNAPAPAAPEPRPPVSPAAPAPSNTWSAAPPAEPSSLPSARPQASAPAANRQPAAQPASTPPPAAPDLPLPTPQQLTAARTQAEAQVQLAGAQLAPLRGQLDALAFPLPGGQVGEAYTPESPCAVIRGQAGQQASAAGEGVVLAVTSFSSLGWVVLLDHGEGGLVTAYLGLNEPAVQVGERVEEGAPLGEIGGSPVFGPDAMAFQVSRVEGGERTPLPPPF